MIIELITLVLSILLKTWDAVRPTKQETRRNELESVEQAMKKAEQDDTEDISKEIGKRL